MAQVNFFTIHDCPFKKKIIMKKIFFCFYVLLINYFVSAQTINIIPQPNEMVINKGSFIFSTCTRLHFDPSLKEALQPLITKLANAAGINLLSKKNCSSKSLIHVKIDDAIINEEGYELKILPDEIFLKAKTRNKF